MSPKATKSPIATLVSYQSPADIRKWAARCGFRRHQDAYEALQLPVRAYYRFLKDGLPMGWPGEYVAREMARIEHKVLRRKD
mgnify:CR=1 FL=1